MLLDVAYYDIELLLFFSELPLSLPTSRAGKMSCKLCNRTLSVRALCQASSFFHWTEFSIVGFTIGSINSCQTHHHHHHYQCKIATRINKNAKFTITSAMLCFLDSRRERLNGHNAPDESERDYYFFFCTLNKIFHHTENRAHTHTLLLHLVEIQTKLNWKIVIILPLAMALCARAPAKRVRA